MKQFVKYAAVGLAGYFVGYYEMKYKVIKAVAIGYYEKDHKDFEEKQKEEA